MFHKLYYLINLLRGIPAYGVVCVSGAVVMKDVPANSVVYGNPCVIKPIRTSS